MTKKSKNTNQCPNNSTSSSSTSDSLPSQKSILKTPPKNSKVAIKPQKISKTSKEVIKKIIPKIKNTPKDTNLVARNTASKPKFKQKVTKNKLSDISETGNESNGNKSPLHHNTPRVIKKYDKPPLEEVVLEQNLVVKKFSPTKSKSTNTLSDDSDFYPAQNTLKIISYVDSVPRNDISSPRVLPSKNITDLPNSSKNPAMYPKKLAIQSLPSVNIKRSLVTQKLPDVYIKSDDKSVSDKISNANIKYVEVIHETVKVTCEDIDCNCSVDEEEEVPKPVDNIEEQKQIALPSKNESIDLNVASTSKTLPNELSPKSSEVSLIEELNLNVKDIPSVRTLMEIQNYLEQRCELIRTRLKEESNLKTGETLSLSCKLNETPRWKINKNVTENKINIKINPENRKAIEDSNPLNKLKMLEPVNTYSSITQPLKPFKTFDKSQQITSNSSLLGAKPVQSSTSSDISKCDKSQQMTDFGDQILRKASTESLPYSSSNKIEEIKPKKHPDILSKIVVGIYNPVPEIIPQISDLLKCDKSQQVPDSNDQILQLDNTQSLPSSSLSNKIENMNPKPPEETVSELMINMLGPIQQVYFPQKNIQSIPEKTTDINLNQSKNKVTFKNSETQVSKLSLINSETQIDFLEQELGTLKLNSSSNLKIEKHTPTQKSKRVCFDVTTTQFSLLPNELETTKVKNTSPKSTHSKITQTTETTPTPDNSKLETKELPDEKTAFTGQMKLIFDPPELTDQCITCNLIEKSPLLNTDINNENIINLSSINTETQEQCTQYSPIETPIPENNINKRQSPIKCYSPCHSPENSPKPILFSSLPDDCKPRECYKSKIKNKRMLYRYKKCSTPISSSSATTTENDVEIVSLSEGEVKLPCECSTSIGEIHLCRFANDIRRKVRILKQNPNKTIEQSYDSANFNIKRQYRYNDNWYAYYVTKSDSSSEHGTGSNLSSI